MLKKFTKKDKRTNLEMEIDEVLEYMADMDPDSKEYTVIVENLDRLYKMKASERSHKIKADTIAIVTANLVGIGAIIWHEKADVITSKALGFILKGRV